MNNSSIEIFIYDEGKTEIQVKLDNDTVWLSQKQMALLFDKDTDTIGLHLKNIYQSGELDELETTEESSVVQLEGKRKVQRKVKLYNLDSIISVGYRVNSKRGVQFRIWANRILKEYLVKGYSINEQRLAKQTEQLKELQKSVKLLGKILEYKDITQNEGNGLLKIISDYAYALDILDQYDYQKLEITETSGKEIYRISYAEAKNQIERIKSFWGNSKLFGNEKMILLKVRFLQYSRPLMV